MLNEEPVQGGVFEISQRNVPTHLFFFTIQYNNKVSAQQKIAKESSTIRTIITIRKIAFLS